MRSRIIAVGFVAASVTLPAQTQTQTTQDVRKEVRVFVNASPVSQGVLSDTMVFVANEFNFDGKPVSNAPYSAESVTESVQILADGNRISRKNTAAVYRDSQGRTRREESLSIPGSEVSQKTIFINDPVAKVSYILDAEKKTARKMSANTIKASSVLEQIKTATQSTSGSTKINMDSRGEYVMERRVRQPNGEETVERKTGAEAKAEVARMNLPVPPPPMAAGAMVIHGGMVTPGQPMHFADSKNAKVDQFGKRVIEGLECTGVKTTITLAAGAIGNERPIDTIQETWTSAELQTVVQTRRTDPRTGETNFKLTNVRRAEPLKTLFEVPSDYKIEEGSSSFGMSIFNQKINKD